MAQFLDYQIRCVSSLQLLSNYSQSENSKTFDPVLWFFKFFVNVCETDFIVV